MTVGRLLLRLPQLPPRLDQRLDVFRFRRSAITTQPAPFQRLRVRRLQTWRTEPGEVTADLRKLFFREWLLGLVVGPVDHLLRSLFAIVAQPEMGVKVGSLRAPVTAPEVDVCHPLKLTALG